jgi:hypothetical protein
MKKLVFLLLAVFLFGCSESLKDTSPVSAGFEEQNNLSRASHTWAIHLEGELCYLPIQNADISVSKPFFKGAGVSYTVGEVSCIFSSCNGTEIMGTAEIINKAGDKLFLEYSGMCSYTNLTRIWLELVITGGTGEYKGAWGDAAGLVMQTLNGTRICEIDLKGNLYLEKVNAF